MRPRDDADRRIEFHRGLSAGVRALFCPGDRYRGRIKCDRSVDLGVAMFCDDDSYDRLQAEYDTINARAGVCARDARRCGGS